jgi:hypothetical protein
LQIVFIDLIIYYNYNMIGNFWFLGGDRGDLTPPGRGQPPGPDLIRAV